MRVSRVLASRRQLPDGAGASAGDRRRRAAHEPAAAAGGDAARHQHDHVHHGAADAVGDVRELSGPGADAVEAEHRGDAAVFADGERGEQSG